MLILWCLKSFLHLAKTFSGDDYVNNNFKIINNLLFQLRMAWGKKKLEPSGFCSGAFRDKVNSWKDTFFHENDSKKHMLNFSKFYFSPFSCCIMKLFLISWHVAGRKWFPAFSSHYQFIPMDFWIWNWVKTAFFAYCTSFDLVYIFL